MQDDPLPACARPQTRKPSCEVFNWIDVSQIKIRAYFCFPSTLSHSRNYCQLSKVLPPCAFLSLYSCDSKILIYVTSEIYFWLKRGGPEQSLGELNWQVLNIINWCMKDPYTWYPWFFLTDYHCPCIFNTDIIMQGCFQTEVFLHLHFQRKWKMLFFGASRRHQ